MLRRKITDYFLKWKNTPGKNSLLVKGPRQVGKTFIIDDFARKNYSNYIYMNFELMQELKEIFNGNLDADTLVREMSIHFPSIKFEPGNLLIFLDEIQSCPNARVSLKSFSLDGRFDVIASGSLLGLNQKDVSSYPVGYETKVELRSLDFEEFLWAFGISDDAISHISDAIKEKKPLTSSVMKKMDEYHRLYAVIGGMPRAVSRFLETNSFGEVFSVHREIIDGYEDDIKKYAKAEDKPKIKNALRSIPAQLAKDNKRFLYSDIPGRKEGEGSREYGNSLTWLHDAGIIEYCYNLHEPHAPLAANIRPDCFKAYMHDTGLLLSLMEPGVAVAVHNGDIKTNKGAIAENITAEELSKNGVMLTYFEKRNSLEVDFILNPEGTVTALEVKSGNNTKSKSLDSIMSEKYGVKRGIKLERTNIYVDEKGVEHYPLFAAAFLFRDDIDKLMSKKQKLT